MLLIQADDILTSLDPEEQILQSTNLTQELLQATVPQNRSLLPNDLQASSRILSSVISVLEINENATDTVKFY